jgi:hypothetical protein
MLHLLPRRFFSSDGCEQLLLNIFEVFILSPSLSLSGIDNTGRQINHTETQHNTQN